MKADYWCLQYSQDQGRAFSSQIQQKTAGGGDGGPSLAHSDTHPPHRRKVRPCSGALFFCCISFVKGKNSDTRLLSLWVFFKSHENMPSAPNNFLWGSWIQVTQSLCLCLISKFLLIASPLQTRSPPQPASGLELPQVLKQMHPTVQQWFVSASSPWHKSFFILASPLRGRTPSRLWTKVNGVVNGVTKGETILVVHFFIGKNTQIITSPCSSLYEYHFTRVSAQ